MMKKIILLALPLLAVLTSCNKDKDNASKNGGIFKGPVTQFHAGKTWTWGELDANGNPLRIAISIDDAAMNSLDEGGLLRTTHGTENMTLVFNPRIVAATPFVHALLDWNPHGHEPAGIYDVPHFDFHFYMTSVADREAIPPYEVDSTGFLNFPAPGYMPTTMPNLYVPTPGGVPAMGAHWIDISTPEINGGIFTQTFLYGSYNGKATFYEPMITKAFLDANATFTRNIPTPNRFAKAGYYPTSMRVEHANGVTNVILENFVLRQAS